MKGEIKCAKKTEQKFGGGGKTSDLKQKITELVEGIENPAILNYIYIIVSDVVKEDKTNEQKN